MRIAQILKLLLLTGFISGCWLTHIKDEAPGSLGNIELLQSFIGQKSESVVRELGLPNDLLSDGDKQFMVYSARSPDTEFLMLIWVPVMARRESSNTLHCLRFELNSDDVVKEYRLESRVMRTMVMFADIELNSSCREVFWSKQERENLKTETIFRATWQDIQQEGLAMKEAEEAAKVAQELAKLEQDASKGDADAQLALFKELSSQDINQALGWLCRSADLGSQEARSMLAKIYQYGGYSWFKKDGGYTWIDKGIVQQDYKLSYLWHALSGLYDQEDLQFFADRHLNSAELSEAKNMLREWRPGQCEKDLGLISHTE